MSRLFVSFLGVALSARPVDFRSPLRYDTEGRLIANIFVSNTSGQSIPVRLGVGRDFAISERLLYHRSSSAIVQRLMDGDPYESFPWREFVIGERLFHRHYSSAIVDFLMIGDPYQSFPLVAPSPSALGDLISSHIGIGPRSFITRNAGSVAVIRNGTHPELILRSTPDHFRNSCMPDSIKRLNKRGRGAFADLSLSDSRYHRYPRRVEFRDLYPIRAYIPEYMFVQIITRLRSLGFDGLDHSVMEYRGCTKAGIASLPTIVFAFDTRSTLLFLPDDYVDFNETDSSCQLR